jgi:leucyl aminopeptidase
MAIKYNVKGATSTLPSTELVVLFWNKEHLELSPKDKSFVTKVLERFSAKGESGENIPVNYSTNGHARSVFMVGMGQNPELDVFRRGVAAAVQYAKQAAIRDLSIVVPENFKDGYEVGMACVEGVELGGYTFLKYQSEAAKNDKERSIQNVDLFVTRGLNAGALRGIKTGKIYAEATIVARDLVNEPATHSRPEDLVEIAQQLARNSEGRIFAEILDRKECEKRGMGAFLAVAQGSTYDPYFIHLFYQPLTKKPANELQVVALVGKGITFDSGGLSIKPAESMESMKVDMAGAATVLGVFSVLEKIQPDVLLHGYIAACENMPSGSAMKPGDIVTTQSGRTVEIRNTDAEGRLTLADAISEALKVKPDAIIDLATLTGACVVSLGEDVAGLFSNQKLLAQQFMTAAEKEGEQIWEMPLVGDYRQLVKSKIADLRNISLKRWGGAITGALFLEPFVEGKPWIHLDIAGPAYTEQQTSPVNPFGASGFGVRTILRYLENIGLKSK